MKREGLSFWRSIALAVFGFVACASTDYWKTPVYVLDHQHSMLRAHEEKDDLEIKVCDPDEQSSAKCYVILRNDYIALRKEYNAVKQALSDLQKVCSP